MFYFNLLMLLVSINRLAKRVFLVIYILPNINTALAQNAL